MISSITTRESFERLRRDGRRVRVGELWCSFVIEPDRRAPAVAFAFGRATGNAVARNRLRRRCRAILAGSSLEPGLYLFGATPSAAELTFDQLQQQLVRLTAKIERAAQL